LKKHERVHSEEEELTTPPPTRTDNSTLKVPISPPHSTTYSDGKQITRIQYNYTYFL
jgi:hypothetical protein